MYKNSQKGNAAIVIAIIIAVGLGVYFIFGGTDNITLQSPSPTPVATVSSSPSVSPTTSPTSSPKTSGQTKSFTVLGSPFEFSIKEMRVKKGDTVKVTFRNTQGTHDWKIDEFNAATKTIQAGQEETIQFIADRTGRFEYYCSVGNHRAMGMKGTLIVE